MTTKRGMLLAAGLSLAGLVLWAAAPADGPLLTRAKALFQPLPKAQESAANPLRPVRVELGKMLYYEPRLSKSGVFSCNSCHNLATYGVDNGATSMGHKWTLGPRNAPTTLNAASHVSQFWDGRAKDVEEQAKGPVLNPKEMASPHGRFVVERIASIPEYVDLFQKAFAGEVHPLTYDNVAKAIGAFERTLVTPGRFDKFLGGDLGALTAEEKAGLDLFIETGCVACHMGPAVGGGMYQKFGVYKPFQTLTRSKTVDNGRFEATRAEADRFLFKVPGLRNVANTYPYFHDGSVWGLGEAVKDMGELQLDKKLTEAEIKSILSFLRSLTGEVPREARTLPLLPPSTEKTSRPEYD